MSWLSSDELRECEPAAAAGRRGNSGTASCTDDDVVVTMFLSPVANELESWLADGGGGNCDGPDTVEWTQQQTTHSHTPT